MANRELRLQPRLQCIAGCVPDGARLADIGTDHGYLPVHLLCERRIPRAIASDINRLPLAHARKTAEEYGVTERMTFRLCAGLDGFSAGESDVIVIAGMGGETILAILEAAPWLLSSNETLLLQPMTKEKLLRKRLYELGFHIASERLVRDKGTIYTVIEAHAGWREGLSAAQLWCGAGLEHDPLYSEYARARIEKLDKAAAGMRRGKNTDAAAASAIEADAAALREAVKEWENANRTGY
ncbi:MAG: SAM-dependent methyltransferase [Oscillospiraceae bacterium]|nr:SAM-dependent methyltransferase [Oscillospiraceae bacterium]